MPLEQAEPQEELELVAAVVERPVVVALAPEVAAEAQVLPS